MLQHVTLKDHLNRLLTEHRDANHRHRTLEMKVNDEPFLLNEIGADCLIGFRNAESYEEVIYSLSHVRKVEIPP